MLSWFGPPPFGRETRRGRHRAFPASRRDAGMDPRDDNEAETLLKVVLLLVVLRLLDRV
jgi:hypothetical protein